MPVPDNIRDADFFPPPTELMDFVKSIDTRISFNFYIHKIKQTSYRFDFDIFINLQGTYWLNYTMFPYGASSFYEVILLRLLHELGHILCGHKGSLKIIGNQEIALLDDVECEQHENEAWKWALSFRCEKNKEYGSLLEICKGYIANFAYQYVDWDYDYETQFKRIKYVYPDIDDVQAVDKKKYEYFKDVGRGQLPLVII